MTGILNLAWLIIIFPAMGLTFNAFFSTRFKEEIASYVAIAASGLAFVMSALVLIALMGLLPEARSVHVPLYTWAVIGNMKLDAGLLIDPLSATMLIVVTFVGTLIHIYSIGYMHGDSRYRRFFVYLNLFMVSMLILVLGDSYVTMFVGWEGVGLCSYLLIGFWFEKEANNNAAKKAFIVNRVGDFGFTLGMFLIFATVGSLQYADVFHAAENGKIVTGVATVITLLLFVGATGKSAQIPLYVWLPDAMAGPTPVSALIHAATMVTAGVYMIARSHPLFVLAPTSQEVVAIVGAATALFAASIAVAQFDIKKVLAYSTISQLGFMVSAVGMGATVAGIFHLGTHAFFKALLFLGAGSVIHAMEHGHHESQISNTKYQISKHGEETSRQVDKEKGFDPNDMRLMGGLSNRMPLTFWTYVVGAAALMGVPPLAGFWSKDEVLAEAFAKGVTEANLPFTIAFWLLLAAAFFTAFYMTRQVLMVFLGKPRHAAAAHAPESPHVMTYVLVTLAFFAAIAGFINITGVFTHWLEPGELFAGLNLTVAGTSIVVALLGIGLGYWVYRPRALPEGVDDPLRSLGFVFSTLNAKYKVDEFYDWLIVRRFKALSQFLAFTIDWRFWHDWFHDSVLVATFKRAARFLANPIDLGIIDGAVNGLARLIGWCSDQLRQVQTGYVRNYALSVLLGVVVIVAYFALR
jgi:NADH-quinone oxidoreductase subunit L